MDDDYMTMTFDDDAGAASKTRKRKPVETSLQRRVRKEREGRDRGRVLPQAEQARQAAAEREAALNTSLLPTHAPAKSIFDAPARAATAKPSKGFAMMAKMGFKTGQALGKAVAADAGTDERLVEPIRIQVKQGRGGIGAETKPTETASGQDADAREATEAAEADPAAYRARLCQEREDARLSRQLHAVQVVAERLACGEDGEDDDADADPALDTRPLSDVNVLWRGMVKARRDRERARQLALDRQRLLDARLRMGSEPVEGGPLDVGASFLKTGLNSVVVDEDEDDEQVKGERAQCEDTELAAFEALPVGEQVQQVADWLRHNRRYCFWCKCAFDTDELDGCPGPTETDHD